MKRTRFTPRVLALIVTVAIGLPSPAFALRGQQREDPSQLASLEDVLKDPDTALRRFAQFVVTNLSSPLPSAPAVSSSESSLELNRMSGLEEFQIKGLSFPVSVAYDPSSHTLFVVEQKSNHLRGFDARTGESTGLVIKDLNSPRGVAYAADRKILFVTEMEPWPGRLRSFNARTGLPTGFEIKVSGPKSVAYDPLHQTLFITEITNHVAAYHVGAGSYKTSRGVKTTYEPSAVAYDPQARELFVTESYGRLRAFQPYSHSHSAWWRKSTYDPPYVSPSTRPGIGDLDDPSGVAYDPNTSIVFVVEKRANRLRAFDIRTGKPTGLAIEDLEVPTGVAYDPDTKTLFVTEGGRNRLRAFSAVTGRPTAVPRAAAPTEPPPAISRRPIPPNLLKRIAQGIQGNVVQFTPEGGFRYRDWQEILDRLPQTIDSAWHRARISRVLREQLPVAEIRDWLGMASPQMTEEEWGAIQPLLQVAPGIIDDFVRMKRGWGSPLTLGILKEITNRELLPEAYRDRDRALHFVRKTTQLLGVPTSSTTGRAEGEIRQSEEESTREAAGPGREQGPSEKWEQETERSDRQGSEERRGTQLRPEDYREWGTLDGHGGADAGLEEKLTLPLPQESKPLPNYEALVQELLQATLDRRGKKGKGLLWVGLNGRTASGKTSLAEILSERLRKERIDAVHLTEDELGVVDRKTRNQWEEQKDPRWSDWRNWVRWDAIQQAFRRVNQAARQGEQRLQLRELYNRSTGDTDGVREVEISPDTVVLYDGMLLAEPEKYPPGTFDLLILLDVTPEESLRRQIARDELYGRDPEAVIRLEKLVYLPFWESYVQKVHPESQADSVYDVTDWKQPIRLTYASSTGLEERMPTRLQTALGADWMKVVVGVYEMAQVTDKVAVLIQPELLGVAGDDGDTQIALMSMEGNLHGAFGWPEQTDLRLGLLTPQSEAAFEGRGYRVIRVVRHPESEETPLPWEAVPVVVAQALAGGQPTFWVNVTPYLNLKEITLPEILATLTNLFA